MTAPLESLRLFQIENADVVLVPFGQAQVVGEHLQRVAQLGCMGRDGHLRCGLLHHDATSGAFYRDQRPLDLSPREGELLRTLMSHVDRVVPKDALRSAVFGDHDDIQADAVEVIVHRLRKKIVGSNTEILTLRGVGYLLCDDAAATAPRGTR